MEIKSKCGMVYLERVGRSVRECKNHVYEIKIDCQQMFMMKYIGILFQYIARCSAIWE